MTALLFSMNINPEFKIQILMNYSLTLLQLWQMISEVSSKERKNYTSILNQL